MNCEEIVRHPSKATPDDLSYMIGVIFEIEATVFGGSSEDTMDLEEELTLVDPNSKAFSIVRDNIIFTYKEAVSALSNNYAETVVECEDVKKRVEAILEELRVLEPENIIDHMFNIPLPEVDDVIDVWQLSDYYDELLAKVTTRLLMVNAKLTYTNKGKPKQPTLQSIKGGKK